MRYGVWVVIALCRFCPMSIWPWVILALWQVDRNSEVLELWPLTPIKISFNMYSAHRYLNANNCSHFNIYEEPRLDHFHYLL